MCVDPHTANLMAENARLRQALEDIVNPIAAMKKQADAEGNILSGWAYAISRDPSYLQQIAKSALAKSAA